jgi:hypothetical protein
LTANSLLPRLLKLPQRGVCLFFLSLFFLSITLVTPNSGGLDQPNYLTFTETDPVTLAFTDGKKLTAAPTATRPANQILSSGQVQPLLTEAFARWQGAGVATSSLSSIDVRTADLPGATLGEAVRHTIYLDSNTAGWGWFVDATPRNDSEFSTPGDSGQTRPHGPAHGHGPRVGAHTRLRALRHWHDAR